MSAEFVSLADLLRGPVPAPASAPDPVAAVEIVPAAVASEPPGLAGAPAHGDAADALRDARLFRARLADALDEAAARLVRDLAADVLARELRLAPCDLALLIRRAAARAPVVRVRVAPADANAVTGLPVVADPALCSGDAIVEVAGGALDARLGVRLAAVLEAFA